jgi:Tfp pilus assembly protein PilF
LVALSAALEETDAVGEAARLLETALDIEDSNVDALIALGRIRRDQRQLKRALSLHVKAVQLAPNRGRAHYELALTQTANGDHIAAEQSFSQAVTLKRNSATFWASYGELLIGLKRFEDAAPTLRRALDLDPSNFLVANKLGIALYEVGKLAEAEVVLTKAIRDNETAPHLYYVLGIVYAKQTKTGLAIGAFQRFLELAPNTDADRDDANKRLKQLRQNR